MMRLKQIASIAMLASVLCWTAGATIALGAEKHVPLQKTIGVPQKMGPVPSLAVLNSQSATLKGNTLTMVNVAKNSIVFADRPVRAAGHVLTSEFIKQWDEGKDSFKADPPNATISVLGGDDGSDVKDAVVVLKSPKIEGNNLVFDVAVLEGDLDGADGSAALFIDWFVAHGGGWHVHGAWYGAAAAGAVAGAAAGAAVASAYHPYYPPPPPACGYYPYPPCY
jgi:hypothetical protein